MSTLASSLIKGKLEALASASASTGNRPAFIDKTKIEEVRSKLKSFHNSHNKTYPANNSPQARPVKVEAPVGDSVKKITEFYNCANEEKKDEPKPDEDYTQTKKKVASFKPFLLPVAIVCLSLLLTLGSETRTIPENVVEISDTKMLHEKSNPINIQFPFLDFLVELLRDNVTLSWSTMSLLGMLFGSTVLWQAHRKLKQQREKKLKLMKRASYLLTGSVLVCLGCSLAVLKLLASVDPVQQMERGVSVQQRWLWPTLVGVCTFGIFSTGILGL